MATLNLDRRNTIRLYLDPSSEPVCRLERQMYIGAVVPPPSSPFLRPHPLSVCSPLVMVLAVTVTVVVVVGQEEVLVGAVAGEGDGSDAEAGEGSLETVESREGALVSPGLCPLPGVVSGLAGGLLEGSHVEAGNVRLLSADGRHC